VRMVKSPFPWLCNGQASAEFPKTP